MKFFDTIAAISTPPGMGGISVVRVSGEDAAKIVSPLVKPYNKLPISDWLSHKLVLSQIISYNEKSIIDEALVVKMDAPHSFTGENVIEIQCHGGYIVAKRILSELINAGARLAEAGEFTRRAFINGKTDLVRAEAQAELISSTFSGGAENAAKSVVGKLSEKINSLREIAVMLAARISAAADYPDEIDELPFDELRDSAENILSTINSLLSGFDTGRVLRDGVLTVIAGRPNVGKSSLLNALLGEEKAIVTDIPGTTRDVIEDYATLKGISLRLMDTAGIRGEADTVEKIGIERAYKNIEKADLCLFVVDSSSSLTDEDLKIFKSVKERKYIVVLNKSDVTSVSKKEICEFFDINEDVIVFTSVPKDNEKDIKELEDKISEMFLCGKISESDVFISNERQREALLKAKKAAENIKIGAQNNCMQDLLYIDLEDLISSLGEITGETVQEEIIDKVFSNFCVGK